MESNVLTISLEDSVWNFLRGERLTSEQITNGLRHTIPEVTKGKVITALKNLRANGRTDLNLTDSRWKCFYL